MIHPIVIAVCVVDTIAVGLLLAAALRVERVVREWAPGTASATQLTLERQLEAGSLFARTGAVLLAGSSLALLVAVTAVLPSVVPGAMCGTGVVEAAGAEWPLLLRGFALLALRGWSTLDGLDRTAPQAPLARATSLLLLVATPLAAWSAWLTASALTGLDGQAVVDCCAAMYAEAAPETGAGPRASTAIGVDGISFAAGAGVIVAVATWLGWGRGPVLNPRRGRVVVALAVATLGWIWVAAEVLIAHLVAYHYEVLAHHCPWCLFLPQHYGVGYPLFGALALAGLEAVAAVAAVTAATTPSLARSAESRARRALRRIVAAIVIYTVIAAGPAVLWWVRFGVWLGAPA